MVACFVRGGGCSMDDSGSGLATAMVALIVDNPALDDCFFLGWRWFDGRQWFWTCYGNGRISSRQSSTGRLFFCWGGGCSMDDSGSGLATAVVSFHVANPTMDVCFCWGGGCSRDDV